VLPVALPPLRERREDIPMLMDHFIERYFRRRGEDVPPVSEAVKQAFLRYGWPGNVRELENACERIAQTVHLRDGAHRLHVGEHPAARGRAAAGHVGAGAGVGAAAGGRARSRSTTASAIWKRT
jgi:transcriptional regulator with PAS, ATPase and Fis domain